MKLRVSLVDSYGRTLAEHVADPQASVKGRFRISNALPARCYTVDARLLGSDGGLVSRRRAELRVPWAREGSGQELEAGEYTFTLETKEPLIWAHSVKEPLKLLMENPRTRAAIQETDPSLLGIPHALWDKPFSEILAGRGAAEELTGTLESALQKVLEE